ncbi:MAG: hypothetical protein ACP5RD_05935 [bacterium]
MSKLLLLDFDGVLFDSSLELSSIVLSIIPKLFKDTKIANYLQKLESIKILNDFNLIKQDYKKIRKILLNEINLFNKYYRKFRTYCTDVDDFYIISKILIDHFENINNLAKITFKNFKGLNFKNYNFNFYYTLKNKLKQEYQEELNNFIENFYEKRRFIKENNKQLWLSFNEPFKNIIQQLRNILSKNSILIAILSTKQKYAIQEILKFYNLDISHIFAKETEFIDKGKKIIEISNLLKVYEIHFVDDLIHNLLRIKEALKLNNNYIDINLYISKWGYNNYETRKIATQNNIKIINSLKDINVF